MKHDRLLPILSGEDRSAWAAAARAGLAVAEPFYRAVVACHNQLFDLGLRRAARLPRRTISVGNITTGGTGKTPFVIDLSRRLVARGARPAVLLRGYRSRNDTYGDVESDETLEYRGALGEAVPVAADPDRIRGGKQVIASHEAVDTFILDDGFQHRQVARDLDLVLIDATRPFGFGHVLPRGLLREPMRNLKRADAVIVTRADLVDDAMLRQLDATIERLAGKPPIAHTAHVWTGWRRHDGETLPLDALRDTEVTVLCGIGNPAAFLAMLTRHVARINANHVFTDHEPYADVAALRRMIDHAHAGGGGAIPVSIPVSIPGSIPGVIVTTEKDWVKLRDRIDWSQSPVPLLRPVLGIRFLDGEDAVETLLDSLPIAIA